MGRLLKNLREDYRALRHPSRAAGPGRSAPDASGPPKVSLLRLLGCFVAHAGFRAVCLYRLGHTARRRRMRLVAALIERVMHHACDCWISTAARIGPGFAVFHVGAVVVGAGCRIGRNCDIRQGVTLGGSYGRRRDDGRTQPVLGKGVSVGAGAKILGPVEVGAGVTVGANAVLTRDVPCGSIVAGIPARVIRQDGEPVPPAEQEGQLADALRDIHRRLAQLERTRAVATGTEP